MHILDSSSCPECSLTYRLSIDGIRIKKLVFHFLYIMSTYKNEQTCWYVHQRRLCNKVYEPWHLSSSSLHITKQAGRPQKKSKGR